MKRRVVEQGGLTLMISLPRKWAQTHNLKKGDELEIQESGKKLVLSTSKSLVQAKQTITIEDPAHFMGRLIQGPYRLGTTNLEINYKDPKVIQSIQKYLENTVGFEIVDQKPNQVQIQMVANESPEEFDKIMKRVFLIVQDMPKELYLAVANKDKSKLDEVIQLDALVNKLTNFAERMLNKHGYSDVTKTNQMYCAVWALEQISDKLMSVAKLLQQDMKVSKLTLELLNDFHSYNKKFYNLFYQDSKEHKDLKSLSKEFIEISEVCQKQSNNHEKNISIYLHAAADLIMHLSLFFN